MRNTFLSLALCCFSISAFAQADAADASKDNVALEDYLDTLGHIAPAARTGTESYLAAYRHHCGRTLTVIELRRAVAEGNGEPTLMAMIRAASQQDTVLLQRLSDSVSCAGRP